MPYFIPYILRMLQMCQNMTLPASSACPLQNSSGSSFKIEASSFKVRPVLLREHLVLCQGAPSAMLGSTGPSYYSPKHLLCTRLPFNSVSLLHHNPHITTKSPPLSHHHITTTNTTSPWYSPESVLLFHRQLMAAGEPDYHSAANRGICIWLDI